MKRTKFILVSLYNGISITSQALKNIGLKPIRTYISEVDKFANKVALHNFPESIELGSVTDITDEVIHSIRKQAKDEGAIILLVGGFPCQDLSYIGKGQGISTDKGSIETLSQYLKLKKEGATFLGSSFLFWEFVRIRETLQPDYILGENVRMKPIWIDIIERGLNLKTIYIDSREVSPQSRKRNYWTNLNYIKPTTPNTLVTEDILDSDAEFIEFTNYIKGKWGSKERYKSLVFSDCKCHTLTASMWRGNYSAFIRNRLGQQHKLTVSECERLQGVPVGYCSAVSKSRGLKALGNAFNTPTIERFFLDFKQKLEDSYRLDEIIKKLQMKNYNR